MNFTTLDLNLLRVLDAVLTEGSTLKAGERLGVSQSAVSNALNRLRYALNDRLFLRQGNQLVPTAFAMGVQVGLREELARLEHLLTRPADFDPQRATGTFRIVAADFFAELLIPQLSAVLSREAPDLLLQLVDWTPEDYLLSLEKGMADMVLGPIGDVPPWVEKQLLLVPEFVVIGSRDNPALANLPDWTTLEEDVYFASTHVMFSPRGELEAIEDPSIARLGKTRKVALSVPIFQGMFRAASETNHLAMVPAALAEKLADQYQLKVFKAPFDIGRLEIHAIWHKRMNEAPLAKWMRGQVFDLMGPLSKT